METAHWITLTLLLSILAMLVQITGYVAPMWIWVEVGAFRVGVGLWYTVGCGLSNTCGNVTTPDIVFGYLAADTSAKPQYDAVRALETLGLAGAVLLVLFLIVYRIGYGRWDRMEDLNRAAFIVCVFAWILILVGLIVYCAFYWPVVGTSPLLSNRSFPWSIIFCLFAALLLIIICVLIRAKCRTSHFVKHAIPTSGDSKMDLHPVTKTGLLNRYFTPSPYREDRRSTYALSAYYDEGNNANGMTRRLIGPEERHVSAIDNVAFQGTQAVENGITYRYLPVPNGGVTQTETVIRRAVPSRVVAYTSDASDINQHQHQQSTTGRVATYVTESTTNVNQARRETGGTAYAPAPYRGGFEPDYRPTDNNAGDVVAERIHFVSRPAGVTTTYRDVVTTNRQADYIDGAGYTGVGRHTTNIPPAVQRDIRIADDTSDERFTRDGRLMANVNYLAPETRLERSRNQWESSTTASGAIRGHFTTHTLLPTGQGAAAASIRVVLPPGSSVKGYDPTYIYRPYSEQIY